MKVLRFVLRFACGVVVAAQRIYEGSYQIPFSVPSLVNLYIGTNISYSIDLRRAYASGHGILQTNTGVRQKSPASQEFPS